MTATRKYTAFLLLALFCCYYSGISFFSHVHIINGASVVHSHLGGDTEHDHSEAQCAIIDILSNFQSECAVSQAPAGAPCRLLPETYTDLRTPTLTDGAYSVPCLRGPPQM